MQQLDWVGASAPARTRVEIPNQRASTSEQKARLCLQIRRACGVIPGKAKGGGVGDVRAWKAALDAAIKAAGLQRATVPELQGALDRLMLHFSPEEVAKVLG